ncbi:MAG: hypothetical protein LWX83_01445 [Anaerolineae bacterium]|nr:hypothetical protein [Anaerolineae bacterium]
MIAPRAGCYAVYEPPEEGWQDWQEQISLMSQELKTMGVDVVPAPEAVKNLESMERVAAWFMGQDIDLLIVLVASWSFDHYTVEIQQKTGVPVIIRAIPGIRSGSIVGSQQLNCLLHDLNIACRLYYGPIGDKKTTQQMVNFARACGIQHALRGARMAVIGRRTEGMTPTAVDEIEILRLFGLRLIHLGLDELLEIAAQVDVEEARFVWQRMVSGAAKVLSRTEHGINSARNYLACKKVVKQHGLSAMTIGSYPKCQGTMCLPIAWLNEEGIPTGCEGDVNASINMLIDSYLTKDPIHFGEMLAINEEDNSLVTSHCGCGSPSLADANGYILHPVRLANDGVCTRYTAKPGPVTYVNLVGRKNNYRLCAFEGEAIPTGMVFEGNPLKFVLKSPVRQVFADVAENGFGHHWMTTYAHITPVLSEFCKLTGLSGVFPDLKEVT